MKSSRPAVRVFEQRDPDFEQKETKETKQGTVALRLSVLPPKKWTEGVASYFYKRVGFQSPQVIGNPERCGAALGYKRFRCNRRWPVWPDPGFGNRNGG